MFLKRPNVSKDKKELGKIKLFPQLKLEIILLLLLILIRSGFSQWVNDPSENTKLVIDGSDQIDLSSDKDFNGGAFIFWQDNKTGFQDEVFFLHVDNTGKTTSRRDGKKVSELTGPEEGPVSTASKPNTAVVVWKDLTYSKSGNLLAQCVSGNGSYLWSPDGIEITRGENNISNYSVSSTEDGYVYISYISKRSALPDEYSLEVQKLSPDGKLLINRDSTVLYSSIDRKGFTSIVPDNEGGAYIFWIEYQNYKSLLLAQRIDSLGRPLWGKKPREISGSRNNVVLYTAKKLNYQSVYTAWQTQKNDKDIYHQIINGNGKFQWGQGGRLATPQKGNQVNPCAIASGSSVILCWTQDSGRDKDIYLQKFSESGKAQWSKTPVPVIKLKGEQFGQKIISDGKGGAIVAWIDMRNDSMFADIYAQKINADGKALWDSLGLKVGSNRNTLKSYLSLVTDDNGGAIAVFKNFRNNNNEIYGQRIFSSGTYVSQIIGFNTKLEDDSVSVNWYAANERGKLEYILERSSLADLDSLNWTIIDTVYADGKTGAKHYQYKDLPDTTGTLYYRIILSDETGNTQTSDISRINYFGVSSNAVVAQNIPNPFSDTTMISIYLPDSGKVEIEFYDSHLEKIDEIADLFPAGENKIFFAANGLKPGIYFYRVKVNGFVDVKKMVITY